MDIREHDLYNWSSLSRDHTVRQELYELRKIIDRQHKRIDKLVKKVQKLEKRKS